MTNLARIKDVRLYVGYTEHALECFQMKKYLNEQGIPFILMAYNDDYIYEELLTNFSNWDWGISREKLIVTKFPFVTWDDCYDDFTVVPNIARNKEEIESKLLIHKSIIV